MNKAVLHKINLNRFLEMERMMNEDHASVQMSIGQVQEGNMAVTVVMRQNLPDELAIQFLKRAIDTIKYQQLLRLKELKKEIEQIPDKI